MRRACLLWACLLSSLQGANDAARRAFDEGRYADAVRLFQQAQKQAPDCNNLFYVGLAHYRMKDSQSALIEFEEAVRCDPKLTLAYVALGEAYAERGDDGQALAGFEKALQLEPANSDALRGAADIYLRQKLNDKAASALLKVTQVDPRDAQAQADLGVALFATGDTKGAEAAFQKALALKPNFPAALLGMANLYIRTGDQERAAEMLRRVVEAAPNTPEPRFLLGSTYNRLGRYADAVRELEKALALGGNDPEIWYHLARAYGNAGRPEDRRKALARFAELTRNSKQDAEARRKALELSAEAKALVDSGDLESALARMEAARELRPSDATILFRLASLNYDLSRYPLARQYAQEAIALTPSEWLYHFLLGLAEGREGHLKESRAALETALKLNDQSADVWNSIAEVDLRSGDARRAITEFERATQLDPKQQAYRANLEAARRAAQGR